MRWAQKQRLTFIGQRILAGQTVNRRDLREAFGISAPQAAIDFRLFNEKHPGAMRYDTTRRAYVPGRITVKPAASERDDVLECLRQLEQHSPNWVAKIRSYITKIELDPIVSSRAPEKKP